MSLLYASELQDPREWVNQNAHDILRSVKKAGGWVKLFPKGVPKWLHKLRNYFNVEPRTLRLVDPTVTGHWIREVRKHGQLDAFIKGKRTLSGDVYFDEEVEVWYQMGPGGTIYHWGRDVNPYLDFLEAGFAHFIRGQTGIPIFKLISPDGTGGSKETIIRNSYSRKNIGDTNQAKIVHDKIIDAMDHQGSYNFAETAVLGLKTHEKYDVDTHKRDSVYIDPPSRFTELKKRFFTEAVLQKAGAETKKEKRAANADFDEPPVRHKPHSVSG